MMTGSFLNNACTVTIDDLNHMSIDIGDKDSEERLRSRYTDKDDPKIYADGVAMLQDVNPFAMVR
jgi:predicted secreted protein